jgi:hypothetical protein
VTKHFRRRGGGAFYKLFAANISGCYTLGYGETLLSSSAENSPIPSQSVWGTFLSAVQQWCDKSQLSINQKDGESTIYQKETFKTPKGSNPLWTDIAAWTYSE